jgi:hypothetical protein
MLPGPGSAAIGAVPSGTCTVPEDQRGLPRPGAGKAACDAGAVETQSGEGPPVGGEEEQAHEQPGGSAGGSGIPGAGGSPVGGSTPTPLKCHKGFKKKIVNGRPKCVKVVKKKHRHHKH